ncbi:hypothetical protein SAMN05660662_1395 [Blastococcus aurantiacus]|uniref:WXG100 family type VII secretion target n=1 Tax=Blastococcus aurantiacus TaxID=1550231 RepID=A0A1G7JAN7_9ACTN|nr:hypothetical protein [Blastococcus aurantiacus]SDF21943.1 hypothetical protein SAMN05660662_1395 [Blastococcus aurantiacus]
MTARAGDWQLLGHGRDPVPGEPAHAQRLAEGYGTTADDIERLSGQLRRMSDLDGWTGEAARKFAEAAGDLAEDLSDAERRYRELAEAVHGWVAPLTRARDESAGALRDAETAEEDRRRYANDPYESVVDPTPDQLAAQRQHTAARDDAVQRLEAARRRLDEALDDLDSAAERVAGRIRDASEHGNDGFWDNVGGWVRDHAVLLDRIATWAGRIALALAVITIAVLVLVAAPAALLMSALFWGAFAAGAVQFGAHAAMMASGVEGVTWVDIGMDVLGLVTAGAGQWIAKGLGKAVPLLRSDVAQAADDSARAAQEVLEAGAANYTRAGNATHIADPANPLRQWGQQYLDDAAERASQAGRQAADDVHAGAVTQAPRASQVTALDADVARELAELQRLGGMQLSAPLRLGLDDLVQQGHRAVTLNQVSTGAQLADGTDDLVVEWQDPLVDATSDAYWHLAD